MNRLGIREGSPILHELRAFVPGYVSILFLSFFITLLFISGPLYIEQVQDRVMTGRNMTTLVVLTAIILVMLLCQSLIELVRITALQRMSMAFDKRVNLIVFQQLNKPLPKGTRSPPAQILHDIGIVRETLGSRLVASMFDIVWFPIILLVLYLLHPVFALLAVILILISSALTTANAIGVKGDLQRHQEATNAANTFGNAILKEAENLRVLGMVPRIRDRWQAQHENMLGWNQSVQQLNNRFGAAFSYFRYLQFVLMQAVGAFLFLENQVSGAAFMAAALLVNKAVGPIDQLISGWSRMSQTQMAIRRLDEFLYQESGARRKISLPRPTGNLQVNRVTLSPPGAERIVLHDISFSLGAGKVLGIAGASGAGKSCLARALVGMWTPLRGVIMLGKHDIAHWNADELGEHLGYMPQDTVLLPGSLAENISRFDPDEDVRSERTLAACDVARIDDLIQVLPDGLNTRIGEPGGHVFSGGQRQRVALARAVYGMPRLVVLDEPNSNLDAAGEQALFQAILELKSHGSTVVVVSHKLSLLNYCDDILVLNQGAVQAFGSRQEVFASISRFAPAKISSQEA